MFADLAFPATTSVVPSGLWMVTQGPSWYTCAYFPRTPEEKSYSGRISSTFVSVSDVLSLILPPVQIGCGGRDPVIRASALMCAGVVPQQPPMIWASQVAAYWAYVAGSMASVTTHRPSGMA